MEGVATEREIQLRAAQANEGRRNLEMAALQQEAKDAAERLDAAAAEKCVLPLVSFCFGDLLW